MPEKINKVPPAGVVFGERVAFVPALPWLFDRPLRAGDIFPRASTNAWIDRGDVILQFSIERDGHRGFWYSLIAGALAEPLAIRIYSPVSGLVLSWHHAFTGEAWIDPKTKLYGSSAAMLAVLVPQNIAVQTTCEAAFGELCDASSRYRESLFRHHSLIAESGIEKVKEIWSDETIDQSLREFRNAPLEVRSASSLGPPYVKLVAEARELYPALFRLT